MNNILLICRALRAGESLADPATWKTRQLRLNAFLPIIYLLAKFSPVDLTADDLAVIGDTLSLIGGLGNLYLTVATTDKVGFKARQ